MIANNMNDYNIKSNDDILDMLLIPSTSPCFTQFHINDVMDTLCQLNDQDAKIHRRIHYLQNTHTDKELVELHDLRLNHLNIRRRAIDRNFEIIRIVLFDPKNARERVQYIIDNAKSFSPVK